MNDLLAEAVRRPKGALRPFECVEKLDADCALLDDALYEAPPVEEARAPDAASVDAISAQVDDFIRRNIDTYAVCLYAALAVYDERPYGELLSFADEFWRLTKNPATVLSSGAWDARALSYDEQLLLLHAEEVQGVVNSRIGSLPGCIVRFAARGTGALILDALWTRYPKYREPLVDVCAGHLNAGFDAACVRALTHWARMDPAFVCARLPALDCEDGSRFAYCAYERILCALARTPAYAAAIENEARRLWEEDRTANIQTRRSLCALAVFAAADEDGTEERAHAKDWLRDRAETWKKGTDLSSREWALILKTARLLGENGAHLCAWTRRMRAEADRAEKRVDARRADAEALLLLYADCMLVRAGRPYLTMLCEPPGAAGDVKDVAALFQQIEQRHDAREIFQMILEEQLYLLDALSASGAPLWAFVKRMAFTGKEADFARWHSYLDGLGARTRNPCAGAAWLAQKLADALARAKRARVGLTDRSIREIEGGF
jgi:hypothetical protein